ncbi:DEAD/DEAH box helicase, partial [Frankia sp. AiPs1]|uniref:DEAD/DEAH box helicase n=1 Tax=Frankia sp. AiPs1 TaxID=573493 RepID=UPI002043DD0E
QRALRAIAADADRAAARIARRRAKVPALRYPDILPVTQRKDEILAAIRDHQVVIIAGETGSGKTTQLPKICLELGRGVRGMIGHTQPRRIAARTVADRIAEELGTPSPQAGGVVGYQTRFTDQVHDDTLVKLMTDGILLAEISTDRSLRRYDTLIIDEAHERSLNIDFILGYLRSLLPRRPDLKVIITSATIETARFSAHFGDAPVIEVSGRTYPVEVRYHPLVPGARDADPTDATAAHSTEDLSEPVPVEPVEVVDVAGG